MAGATPIRKSIVTDSVKRVLMLPYRAWCALRVTVRPMRRILPWLARSKECTSWTYHLTDRNRTEACSVVAMLTSRSLNEVLEYMDEVLNDPDLAEHVRTRTAASADGWRGDAEFKLGRRLLYYLIVRARRPRVVVEAGVDKGLGAALICRALQRNRIEGAAGRYLGVDTHEPGRAFLFSGAFSAVGRLQQGDAVDFLERFDGLVDFYIHDTTPESGHLQACFSALWPNLAPRGVVCCSWATNEAIEYLVGRATFLTFVEEPENHWYPGSRLLIAARTVPEDPGGVPQAPSVDSRY